MPDLLSRLPVEIGHDILCCGVLGPLDIVHLEQVSSEWRARVRDEPVWHRLAQRWGLIDPALPRGATLRQVVLARTRDGHDEQGCLASTPGWRDYVCLEELIQRQFGQTLGPSLCDSQIRDSSLAKGQEHDCVHHRSNSVPLQAVISHTFSPLGLRGELRGMPLSPPFPRDPFSDPLSDSVIEEESSLSASLPRLSHSCSPSPSPRSTPDLANTSIVQDGADSDGWTLRHRSGEAGAAPGLSNPDFVCAVPEDGIYVCSQRSKKGRRTTWTINCRTYEFLANVPVSVYDDNSTDTEPCPHVSKPALDGTWLVQSYFHPHQRQWALELFRLSSRLGPDETAQSAVRGLEVAAHRGVYLPLLTIPLPLEIVGRYGIAPPLRTMDVVRLHYPLAVV